MFGFGKLLATPIRLLNVPLRAAEKLLNDDDDRVVSAPLEAIAEAVEEAVDGEDAE